MITLPGIVGRLALARQIVKTIKRKSASLKIDEYSDKRVYKKESKHFLERCKVI